MAAKTEIELNRRSLLKIVPPAALGAAATMVSFAEPASAAGQAKVIFVLFKRADITREECLADWQGERHTSIVKKVPGLNKWVQNHVISEHAEGMPVGIGGLWFDDAETMDAGMNSPEMGAAVEDAKNFLDMDKTFAIVCDERSIIG